MVWSGTQNRDSLAFELESRPYYRHSTRDTLFHLKLPLALRQAAAAAAAGKVLPVLYNLSLSNTTNSHDTRVTQSLSQQSVPGPSGWLPETLNLTVKTSGSQNAQARNMNLCSLSLLAYRAY